MQSSYSHLPCGFLSLNHAGIITYANPFFCEWIERVADEVEGQHVEQFLSVSNKFVFYSYFYPMLHINGIVQEFVLHFETSKEQQLPAILSAIRLGQGEQEYIDCIIMPMTQRMKYERELRDMTKQLECANAEKDKAFQELQKLHQAIEQRQQELITLTNTDKLTSLYNRRYIEEHLARRMQQAEADSFSVLLVDIDFFKKVNDTYGHQIGDYVLIEVARLMREHIGEYGIVARYGGEEFLILLSSANQQQSMKIGKALNRIIREYLFEYVQHITISIGIATYREGDSDTMIVNRADRALYYSKEHGRDCVTHFRDIEGVLHP